MGADDHTFDGFISYSHADRRAARRVQRYLERYRLPGGRARLRIFRDDTDIRAGNLPAELEDALSRSRTLIVCCSSAAADARWVEKEIATFLAQDGSRPVLLLLLDGRIEDVAPETLRNSELRYCDLRRGSFLNWMRPRAQIELVRAIAALARLELRDLIPWDRRRRRRNAFAIAGIAILALAVTAFFPFQSSYELPLPQAAAGLRVLEFCDVMDGRLILTARERSEGPQGSRNYVAYFPDALGSSAEEFWLDDYDLQYVPSHRLVHSAVLSQQWLRKATSALDMDSLFRHASTLATEQAGTYEEEFGERRTFLRRGFWAGEPRPGIFVALAAIAPLPPAPGDEYEPPHEGRVVIGVAWQGQPTRVAEIPRLYPREASELPLDRRSANLNDGLPMATMDNTIWIGMPVRADGGAGGLWRSNDYGSTWQSVQEVSASIGSLLADTANQRLLLATAPGRWDGGVRDGVFDTELHEWNSQSGQWTTADGPPASTNADVQFCGMLDSRTRITRVDRQLFATAPDNLLRRILRNAGRQQRPVPGGQ